MRIANPGVVYRSTNPTHLKTARANEAARQEALEGAGQYASDLIPGGLAFGHHHDDGGFTMTGIAVEHDTPTPDGMRVNGKTKARNGRVLVPRMKSEKGKAIAHAMAQFNFTPKPMGSVSRIVIFTDGKNRWFGSGVIEIIGHQVFAEYHHPIDDERGSASRPSDREQVEADPDWISCPLSDFYAARERVSA